MSRGSKKQRPSEKRRARQQQKKEEQNRTRDDDLRALTAAPYKGPIPPTVAQIPGDIDYEAMGYQISLKQLDLGRKSNLNGMSAGSAAAMLAKLKLISETQPKHATQRRLFRDSLSRGGAYDFLYSGLSKDVTVREVAYFSHGRIFGYTAQNVFSVVGIHLPHVNIDK